MANCRYLRYLRYCSLVYHQYGSKALYSILNVTMTWHLDKATPYTIKGSAPPPQFANFYCWRRKTSLQGQWSVLTTGWPNKKVVHEKERGRKLQETDIVLTSPPPCPVLQTTKDTESSMEYSQNLPLKLFTFWFNFFCIQRWLRRLLTDRTSQSSQYT
jgi:hypothetical protein